MSRMLFINLPVTDVARSEAFYAAIGAILEPKFSNDAAKMMRDHRIRHLVVQSNKVVGVFTSVDVCAVLAELFKTRLNL